VRFFLDHNVPISVRSMLLGQGHECWTAAEAGLAAEGQNDNLSVYADSKHAVLVTFDREFSQRRRKNPIGHHIWMSCPEPRAALVLQGHLTEVLQLLRRQHVTILVTVETVTAWSKSQ
jgi:predicted nuclease of predicted toxin-antitoxin system